MTVTKNEEFFARLLLQQNDVTLKIEMINDVPSHIGEIRHHSVLGREEVMMTKAQFVGAWQLISSEFRRSDSTVIYPYGPNAIGNLYYDAAGNMAVQLLRADRPLFAAGDRQQGTPEEVKLAFEGSLAYFGRYEVDEQAQIVIHHVVGCTFPNWIGQPQKRIFAFVDNQLTLSTPPLRVGGSTLVGVLRWQRIP